MTSRIPAGNKEYFPWREFSAREQSGRPKPSASPKSVFRDRETACDNLNVTFAEKTSQPA
jgi:hypothetical protein